MRILDPAGNWLSTGHYYAELNGRLYFDAWTEATGNELWSIGPGEAEPTLVKDIRPGALDSNIRDLYDFFTFDGVLYFQADAGQGSELWRTDGTSAGTRPAITSGPYAVPSPGGQTTPYVKFAGSLYFVTYRWEWEPRSISATLWKSDDGTGAVTTIMTNSWDSFYAPFGGFKEANGQLFFTNTTEGEGAELWVTDGTAGGTRLVSDIHPGSEGSRPENFVVVNDVFYFTAAHSFTHGRELWRSDGTAAGTVEVFDQDFEGAFRISGSVPIDSTLYFTAGTHEGGYELWSLDTRTAPTDLSISPGSVPETPVVNTVVGTLVSEGVEPDDTYIYALVAGSGDVDNARFTIVDDQVVALEALDFELRSSYSIRVRTTDQTGLAFEKSLTITAIDIDEFNVGPITDTNAAPNSVPEHSPIGTPVGITAFASDADGTNSGITYMLWDTRGGRFAIDSVTGVVTVANSELLDHAANPVWAIRILAISQDGSFSFKDDTITVARNNAFSVSSVSDTAPAANVVSEGALNGTAVGITASAFDADSFNNTVSYSLTNSASGRFAIHATTGVVTVANASLLNHETAASHVIVVRATSSDGSFSDQPFTINVSDVDEFDVGPITDTNTAANSVSERSAAGTPVGITAFASDADGTNSGITYMLWDTRGGRFAINSATGVVTVANPALLNRATDPLWSIRVLAISQDGSFSFRDFTIAIT